MAEGAQLWFFYGTLQDADLRAAVLGAEVAGRIVARPARLRGWRALTAPGEAFPAALRDPDAVLEGVLASGIDGAAAAAIAAYEGPEYAPVEATAALEGEDEAAALSAPCRLFAPTSGLARRLAAAAPTAWDVETWRRTHKARALLEADALRRYAATPPQSLSDRLWPEIRAEALVETDASEQARLGAPFGRDDVEETARIEVYRGFYGVQELSLRHRQFPRPPASAGENAAAAWGRPIRRGVFRAGDGAVALPYDPKLDCVLLIEQWRMGPWAAGDPRPWSVEAIAGRIDPGVSPEETVRREALEEAGLRLGRLAPIGVFYSSPGASDERLHYFCAEADLSEAGGVFGEAVEDENIRAFVVDYETAMTALALGHLTAGPAALALLWLSRRREELALRWR